MPKNDSTSRSFPFRRVYYLLTASPADPRQRLNNLLQSMGMTNDLRWDISGDGPPHNRVWYAICLSWSFS